MKKLVLLLSITLTASVWADLGQTHSQIEAKYGKETKSTFIGEDYYHCPETIKDKNGKVYQRPQKFDAVYHPMSFGDIKKPGFRGSFRTEIFIHYNDKGIATEVRYRCSDIDSLDEDTFNQCLEMNGFKPAIPASYVSQFYHQQSQLYNTYYRLDGNTFLSLEWTGPDGSQISLQIAKRTEEEVHPKVVEISFTTMEGFGERQKNMDRWKEYFDIAKKTGQCIYISH